MRLGHLDVGLFLVSASALLIELLLTRIFSVTMFFHLSFLVVSLAMLGVAASGVVLGRWPGRFAAAALPRQTGWAALGLALGSVAAVALAFALPVPLQPTAGGWVRLGLILLAAAVPFFCAGLVVSLILAHHTARAHRAWFFDLAGASAGCLVMIPATGWLGAPSAVLAGAALAALGAAALAGRAERRLRAAGLLVAAALALAAGVNPRLGFFDARYVKGSLQPATLATRWNAFSRVDVPGSEADLWRLRQPRSEGLSSRLDPSFSVPQVDLRFDGDSTSRMLHDGGDLRRVGHLALDVSASAYAVRRPERVLVIGPGGGVDVLQALVMGSGHVTGVEVNPVVVDLLRTRFATFSGGLYSGRPGVAIAVDDGRAYLRRHETRYDLISAVLADTWAATPAGAHALAENSLYTVEAFGDYLSRLTPGGMVAFTRWFDEPPAELLRLTRLAAEALRREGVTDPARHVMVVRTDPEETGARSLASLLVKRAPFTDGEVQALRRFAGDLGFLLPHRPGPPGRSADARVAGLLGPRAQEVAAQLPYDVSPVTDDRPFFFSRVPLLAWIGARLGLASERWAGAPLGLGGTALLLVLGGSLLATAALLLAPVLARPAVPRLPGGRRRSFLWAVYFAGLGVGFMAIEVALIQRFTLFLGYPIHALAVVLFTVLLAAGVGSAISGRAAVGQGPVRVLIAVAAGAGVLAVLLPATLALAGGLSLIGRIGLVVASVAPVALLMGMPFPAGLRRARAESPARVPRAWAINGSASVLGSALAVALSMASGFRVAFVAGACAYLVALAAAAALFRGDPAPLAEARDGSAGGAA